jgi:hypothetical protein
MWINREKMLADAISNAQKVFDARYKNDVACSIREAVVSFFSTQLAEPHPLYDMYFNDEDRLPRSIVRNHIRNCVDLIISQHIKNVEAKIDTHLQGEEFIDKIIDRINRKQIKGRKG